MRTNRSGRRNSAVIVVDTSPAGCIGDPAPAGFVTRSTPFGLLPRSADVFSVAPAGDLATGTPANRQAPGTYRFRSNVQMVGVEPTINAGAFRSNLALAVNQIMGAAVTVNAASATKGARQTQRVQRTGVGGFVGRHTPLLNMPVEANPLIYRDAPTWWVTIEGTITAAAPWVLNGDVGLNRAIARAFNSSSSFTSRDDDYPAPRDGGPLNAAFQHDGACSGYRDFASVFAAACTRVEPAAAPVAAPPVAAPQGPVMTPIPPPANGNRPASPATVGATCPIRIQSPMWLRPTPTFDRTGPQFPAGTAVVVTGAKVDERGTLGLYPVTVGTQRGYAALSAEDFLGCTAFAPPPRGASSPAAPVAPAPPILAPLPMPEEDTGTSPWVIGGVTAAVATAGIVAYVKRDKIKAYFAARKKNGRPRRARR